MHIKWHKPQELPAHLATPSQVLHIRSRANANPQQLSCKTFKTETLGVVKFYKFAIFGCFYFVAG